jgi:hypothetical protein
MSYENPGLEKEKNGIGSLDLLSERDHEIVESIESLSSIDDTSKLDLILTWCGEKLATELLVALKTCKEGEHSQEVSETEKQEILEKAEATISSMGLSYIESDDLESELTEISGYKWRKLYVASLKENAEKLKQLWDEKNEAKNAQDFGKMFGFPPSAIEVFIRFYKEEFNKKEYKDWEITIEEKDLPKEIQEQDFMAFALFRLSRNNWQEELKTAKRWADKVKNIDSELYKRIIEHYKENNMENKEKQNNVI